MVITLEGTAEMAHLWWSSVFVELHPEKWDIDISKSPICHHSFELFATRTEIINRVFSQICYQSWKKPLLRRHYWVKPYRLVYCTCLYVFQFPPAKWVLTYTAPSTILVLPPPRSDVWREGGKERVKIKYRLPLMQSTHEAQPLAKARTAKRRWRNHA